MRRKIGELSILLVPGRIRIPLVFGYSGRITSVAKETFFDRSVDATDASEGPNSNAVKGQHRALGVSDISTV
jgi:hypothetical protein